MSGVCRGWSGLVGGGCRLFVSWLADHGGCLSFFDGRVCLVVPWGVCLGVQIGVHRASVGGFHTGLKQVIFGFGDVNQIPLLYFYLRENFLS